jgi:Tfp pilus assembly protein PilP
MKPIVKHVLAGVTVISALASVVAGRESHTYTPVREPAARIETRLPAVEDIDLGKLEERAQASDAQESKVDAFAPRNFSPVVPAQTQAAAAKPTVPPLPFRYIGKMQDGDKLAVFLMNGNDSLAVAAGERIGEYRVEKITDAEIVFTYLPLKTKQSLPL